MLEFFKHLWLGFKAKMRDDSNFAHSTIMLGSVIVIVPIMFMIAFNYLMPENLPLAGRVIFSIFLGSAGWFLTILALVLIGGLIEKIILIVNNLITAGKKEEFRIIEILKQDPDRNEIP